MGIEDLHGTCKKCGCETIAYVCYNCLSHENAALREQLAEAERKLAAMTAAIQPFAAYGNQIDANWSSKVIPDTAPICYSPEHIRNDCPTMGDCRTAARALEAEPGKEKV